MTRRAEPDGTRPRSKVVGLVVAMAMALALVAVLLIDSAFREGAWKPELRQDTPESAYHSFHVALIEGDAEALARLTLPIPAEDFAWLLKGKHLARVGAEDFHRSVMRKKALRRLGPGDELKLPGGRSVTIGPDQVGIDRAVLLPEGSPIPTDVRRVEGLWRVDPRPVIAGRKAADAAIRGKAGP